MEPAEAFGSVLRRRRLAASLTQEKLGANADIERVQISWLEGGRHLPTLQTTFKLARALGCKASELIAEAEALMTDGP